MGMTEYVIGIVLTVALFMVIAYVFIHAFGYPTCVSMANQTALQLKYAINDVAKDEFPTYREDDVPVNPSYYKEVPIRLCNEFLTTNVEIPGTGINVPGYSWFLQFVGGTPEYQIYYEKFPEGGWLWNEAYPWSGGTASIFVFWGVMRGVTWIAPKLVNAWYAYKGAQLVAKGTDISLGRIVGMAKAVIKTDSLDEIIQPALETYVRSGRNLDTLLEALGKKDLNNILDLLADAGLVKGVYNPDIGETLFEMVSDGKGGWKILLNDGEIPATVVRTDPTTGVQQIRNVFAYQEGGGALDPTRANFDDMIDLASGETPPPNYVQVTFNPKEQMEMLYDSLKETQPRRAEMIIDQFALKDDALKPSTTLLRDEIENVNYFKQIYNGLKNKWDEIKTFVIRNGYLVDTTSTTGKSGWYLASAMEELAQDPVSGQAFRETVLEPMMESKDLGIWDTLRYQASKIPGIDVGPEVDVGIGLQINKRVWEEYGGGFRFLWEGEPQNVYIKITDAIKDGMTDTDEIMNFVRTSLGENYNKYFSSYGGWNRITDDLVDLYRSSPGLTADEFEILWREHMLRNLVDEVDSNEMFQQQLGLLIGNVQKDASAYPVPLWRKYAGKQVRKTIFIDGSAFIAPNSWIGKGLILEQMTEGCMGNSICLYVHASQYESPYYMSEDVTNFFIRVWRPVDPWQNYAGWQAALQHVPAHPRFYVVSPCFAIAKVWKTVYNNEDTIFVYPIEVDMGNESSNWCYADEYLIDTYTAMWAAEDIATVIEAIISWGGSAAKVATEGSQATLKAGLKTVADTTFFKWYDALDPASFIEGMAEAAVAWPGYPYRDLNYTEMNSAAGQAAFHDLEEQLRNQAE